MSKLIPKRKKLSLFVFSFILIFLFVFVHPFRAGFKNFSLKVFLSPVRFLSGITGGVKTGRSVAEENKDLRAKVTLLFLEIEQFKDLYRENKRLRGLLDFKKNIGFRDQIIGIGISSAGPFINGRSLKTPNICNPKSNGWEVIPLLDPLETKWPGIPIILENDCISAILAEHAFGAAIDVDNCIYITDCW